MLPVALGLHAVWREPVLRQLTPGVMRCGGGYVSFPLEAIGVRWMYFTNDGGLVVVRVRYSGSTCVFPAWRPRREQSQRKP